MSLASTEYDEGENEFIKSGLTMVQSDLVRPFRVAESPVQFECKVTKVEPLGSEGGAGNLVFSEVLKIHIRETILNAQGAIDQHKIDQVARMGGNWYTRANKGLFEVQKPLTSKGIGVDSIPEPIRTSSVLSGNDLGMLGNVEKLPSRDEIATFLEDHNEIRNLMSTNDLEILHTKAKEFLNKNDVLSAWKVLMVNQ